MKGFVLWRLNPKTMFLLKKLNRLTSFIQGENE